jgi:hypothetical protein
MSNATWSFRNAKLVFTNQYRGIDEGDGLTTYRAHHIKGTLQVAASDTRALINT